MSECRSCGATWPTHGQVCLYCGSEIPERIMAEAQEMQERQDRLTNVHRGMHVLRNMPSPSTKTALLQVLWWYLLFGTFGISYLFWKRPKSGFDSKTYQHLVEGIRWNANEIERVGTPQEKQQVRQAQGELQHIERVVGTRRRKANRAIFVAVGLILAFGIVGAILDEPPKKAQTEQKD